MKSALIAVDPIAHRGQSFENFCHTVSLFQKKGLCVRSEIISLIHSSHFTLPVDWYHAEKEKLKLKTAWELNDACRDIRHSGVNVVSVESYDNDDWLKTMDQMVENKGADVLVIGGHEKRDMQSWLWGSYSEVAASKGTSPVLVIKTSAEEPEFAADFRAVIAVDVTAPWNEDSFTKLLKTMKTAEAHVDLVYVQPHQHFMLKSFFPVQTRDQALKFLANLKDRFQTENLSCDIYVLDEDHSIARTLSDFAEKKKAWMLVTLRGEETSSPKLFGSTSLRILRATSRPFFHI